MTKLGPWELAAMDHEVGLLGDAHDAALFVGGITMGMAIANRHPEYAQAAAPLSQQAFREERPDVPSIEDATDSFVQAVPISVLDEVKGG